MRRRHRSYDFNLALFVPRCKVCAEHTDVRCYGCQQPICLRHNAAPNLPMAPFECSDCRYSAVVTAKGGKQA